MGHRIVQALVRGFLRVVFSCKTEGLERVPSEGGAIIALNHRSYWDVVFAGAFVRRPLRYMAKASLFDNPLFARLITSLGAFPIQRGRGDIGAIKSALGILKSGNVMLIFPEGRRVLDGSHIKPKPGVALISSAADVPVVPVCISGRYRFRHRITIRAGEPIYPPKGDAKRPGGQELQKMADNIMDSVYAMEVSE